MPTCASTKPKFFVQGEADEVCPLEALWSFYGRLEEPKEIVVVDAADHLFEGKTVEVDEFQPAQTAEPVIVDALERYSELRRKGFD